MPRRCEKSHPEIPEWVVRQLRAMSSCLDARAPCAAAPARVLSSLRMLLLLRLHGRACFTVGTKPCGVRAPGLSVGCWSALALCIHACTLTKECSTIWALTARCVHVRLLELARMTEIGSGVALDGCVQSLRARESERVGSSHLLQHNETR